MDSRQTVRITPQTKVGDLLDAYPFLIEELSEFNSHYTALRDPQMRAMMAPVATLEMAAMRGGVDVNELMNFVTSAISRRTGRTLLSDASLEQSLSPARLQAFRDIMVKLHEGGDLETAQREFATLAKHADPGEIAEMEQHLIAEGMPISELKRMCDAHLQVVESSLDSAPLSAPPGHPVDTHLRENRRISDLLAKLKQLLGSGNSIPEPGSQQWAEFSETMQSLSEIDRHYLRKEHQLFSFLERKGFTGPSQVMWAVHDDIRAQLKTVLEAIGGKGTDVISAKVPVLLAAIASMIQKEEKILLPTALQLLDESEWQTIASGERELGFMSGCEPQFQAAEEATQSNTALPDNGLLALSTGAISLEQLNLIITHLPVELSFVDERDTVQFYSNQPHKIFARTPDAIGRKVQNCHPPKSVHLVNQILADFRSGKRDSAEFWIELNGVFVHIRYFAIRDKSQAYRGSLEVVQDVTAIRELEGERRLLAEAEDS